MKKEFIVAVPKFGFPPRKFNVIVTDKTCSVIRPNGEGILYEDVLLRKDAKDLKKHIVMDMPMFELEQIKIAVAKHYGIEPLDDSGEIKSYDFSKVFE